MEKLLCICIAAYNRKNIIVPDVNYYLSLNDDRFNVVVQDDGSTDGTYEELERINNPKLKLRRNPVNLGGLQNAKEAMDNNEEFEYVLKLDDKDLIDIAVLPQFLDYLEKYKPNYGYVDLSNNKPVHIEIVERGIEAINKIAYQCKHPSGFFWRYSLYHEEIHKDYYKKLPPKFDYQFDLMYAHCAVRYDGVIVYMPLIINSFMRPELAGNKSYSYSESNLFFGAPKRLETYEIFLKDIQELQVDVYTKRVVLLCVTNRTLVFVTSLLRYFLQHEEVCYHYNLTPRVVSVKEMESNIIDVLRIYKKYAKHFYGTIPLLFKNVFLFIRYTIINLKIEIKEKLIPYKQQPMTMSN